MGYRLVRVFPREPVEISVKELKEQLAGIRIDERFALKQSDPKKPVLIVYLHVPKLFTGGQEFPEYWHRLLIDGHLRLFRTVVECRPTIKAYLLDKEESAAIQRHML